MNLGLSHSPALLLLPLALLPLVFHGQPRVTHASLALLPGDRLSDAIGVALRVLAALLTLSLILGIGGLFRKAESVVRIGQGAQMVLLLDRSRSMDQPFGGNPFQQVLISKGEESKGDVARKLLSKFVASRRNDMFAMVAFSTYPIQTLPLTDRQAIVQAAIAAGNVGRGLAKTDVGAGLLQALEFFEGLPYTGSRIIMLISDGGSTLDLDTRLKIKNAMQRQRAALYWIYIRSRRSPGISDTAGEKNTEQTAPARALHEFFSDMEAPYRAYDAEDPQAMEDAIDQVSRLQNLPIRFVDVIPRRDLSATCYLIASLALFVLIGAKLIEKKAWM